MEYCQFVGHTTAPLAFCITWPMIQLSAILAQGTQITFTVWIQCQCLLLCTTDEILTLTIKLPKWLPFIKWPCSSLSRFTCSYMTRKSDPWSKNGKWNNNNFNCRENTGSTFIFCHSPKFWFIPCNLDLSSLHFSSHCLLYLPMQ